MKYITANQNASIIEYAIRDVVLPAERLEKEGHKLIKLNIGDPLAYPLFKTPKHMIDAYIDALNNQSNGYSPSYGIEELRSIISKNESQKGEGWQCKKDDVYICHGVTEALQVIFGSFLEKGDKVLAPGPHYPPYMAYPQIYGAETIEYKLDPNDAWNIDLEDLESKMNNQVKLLVLINPNNPTGGIISKSYLERIIRIVEKWPLCTIISDEIYDMINFTNYTNSTASLSKNVPVISLNGVSKVYYAPGWRIGYMAWHDPLSKLTKVRDAAERLLRSRLCASTPAQFGYLAGLKHDKTWMNVYQKTLLKNRNYCLSRIEKINGIETQIPYGSFYMFVKITSDKWRNNDKEFVLQLLQEQKVLTVHGSGFSQKYGKGHFRIVFLPQKDILSDAFDKIDCFLNK